MLAGVSATPRRLLLTTDAVGGIWRYSLDLAIGLGRLGVETVLLVAGPPPSPDQSADAEGIPGLQLELAGGVLDWMAESESVFRAAAERVAARAGCLRADAIQVHAPAYAAVTSWDAPVVAVAHSCTATWWDAVCGTRLPPNLRWRGAATRKGLARADAVIAPSWSFVRALRTVHGLERDIAVVHNGTEDYPPDEKPTAPYLLTAGRLWDPAKNMALLDSAAASVPATIRAAGPITGPGGEAIALAQLALLGSLPRDRMAEHYTRASAFISIAKYEPFGLAVLEAARARCALVLSDIATFRELWDGAALFVGVDDASGLAEILRSLVKSPQRCGALAELAFRRSATFTVDAMAHATWAVHRACATRIGVPAGLRCAS